MTINSEFKKALSVICTDKFGYEKELKGKISPEYITEFETVGFITKGHTLKEKTWRKTRSADSYYIELFGYFSFLKMKILSLL